MRKSYYLHARRYYRTGWQRKNLQGWRGNSNIVLSVVAIFVLLALVFVYKSVSNRSEQLQPIVHATSSPYGGKTEYQSYYMERWHEQYGVKEEPIIEEVVEEQVVVQQPIVIDDLWIWASCVQTEVNGGDFESMTHVASVIQNRMNHSGKSAYQIITSPNQFAYGREPTQQAYDAVEYVVIYGDTAQGARYFHSSEWTSTFCGNEYIFTDSVGHHFY